MNAIETPQDQTKEPSAQQAAADPPFAATVAERISTSEPIKEALTSKQQRNLRPIGIAVSVVLAIAIAGIFLWKFLPYTPAILPSAIALGHIVTKNWNSYKPSWKRWPIFLLVLAAGCGGVAFQYHQIQEKAGAALSNKELKGKVDALQGKADATLAAQKNSTEVFAQSFMEMNKELSDLKTKVATEALRKEITTLQSKLDDTKKALTPAPKAALTFSFLGYKNPKAGDQFIPLHETTLPATAEGMVKIPIALINTSEFDALQGHANFFICDACKYAKEPRGMVYVDSMPKQARDFQFQQILAADTISDIVLEVIVPRNSSNIKIAVQHRCRTCIFQKEAVQGTINITWP